MKCKCGGEIEPDAHYCVDCGRPRRRTWGLIEGVVVGAVLAATVASAMVYDRHVARWGVSMSPEEAREHAQVASAAMHGCEMAVRGPNGLGALKINNVYELTGSKGLDGKMMRLKDETWVVVEYRAPGDGKLVSTGCHYEKLGDDTAMISQAGPHSLN